jgi:hypothetical protein
MLKLEEWGERTKKVISFLNEIMNDNPKCHLHILQPWKGIYMLNNIVQGILGKKGCEAKASRGNTQNLNAPNKGTKPNGGENLKGNS